ncbi:MAG TPA: LLM class F420-dependent oxidoreductase [Ktedonobacterales bacterium]|jgi:probable F420-dependent oxidoreductase
MQFGVTFPQTEIGNDPSVIRDYAQAAEELGYHHILAYDHVLGASLSTRPNWSGPYNSNTAFHEPFVLFGYLAAITKQVELVTGVIILPQRQTALVAKQAAAVDVLSGGRLRLGVGVGWNDVEYEGLNEDFHNRGVRSEEQIAVLRALWKEPAITFEGRWHHINNAGINPLPVRRSIPLWIGGSTDITLKRVARIGDGWFPQPGPEKARGMIERLRDYAQEAGRDPKSLGIEARLSISQMPESAWASTAEAWRKLDITYLGVNTMNAGLASPRAHIDMLRKLKQVLGF